MCMGSKKGLILEGGAMRCMFTCGVIDVMMEHGVIFDGAIGVSAGAGIGVNYKSHQIGRGIRYNKRFCGDKRYGGIYSFLKTGNLFSAEFCFKEVPLKHDLFDYETYINDPMEFYITCTDIETGKPVYWKFEDQGVETGLDWIRAGSAMPVVSQIVEIDGKKLLDGGVADSIPLKYFESLGYNKNIVILTQPQGYRKYPNNLMPLIKRKYKQYPKLIETMANRHNMYNETLEYIAHKEQLNEVLVIRPKEKLPVGRVEKDPNVLQKVYEIGRKVGLEEIEKIKNFLGE